jgi:hypothetical protein
VTAVLRLLTPIASVLLSIPWPKDGIAFILLRCAAILSIEVPR